MRLMFEDRSRKKIQHVWNADELTLIELDLLPLNIYILK